MDKRRGPLLMGLSGESDNLVEKVTVTLLVKSRAVQKEKVYPAGWRFVVLQMPCLDGRQQLWPLPFLPPSLYLPSLYHPSPQT